jgi:hypothetical protein
MDSMKSVMTAIVSMEMVVVVVVKLNILDLLIVELLMEFPPIFNHRQISV